jgi:hypothetical protein
MPEAYRHPMEDIEPEEVDVRKQAQEEAQQMFKETVLPCLPSAGYGKLRRFAAGYNRWVVVCYYTAPDEWFSGVTKRDLARYLGLTYRALMLEFNHVEALLGSVDRTAARRSSCGTATKKFFNCNKQGEKMPGPSQAAPLLQVPRDSKLSP